MSSDFESAGAGVTDHTKLTNIGTNTHAQVDTAVLNSVAHIAAAAPHTEHVKVTVGSYTGDNTVNKAISHGLGRTPKIVFLVPNDAGTVFRNVEGNYIGYLTEALNARLAVTIWDTTNFYVGNATNYGQSANAAVVYNWVAIG